MNKHTLSRRNFLKLGAFSTAMATVPALHSPSAAPSNIESKEKTNFLFIIVDDLGWSDIGCFGADLHETPNIDKLALQGQKFINSYAAAPVCSPTRAALLTGKSPATLNMTIWRESARNTVMDKKLLPPDVEGNLPLEEVTLAEILNRDGYITAHLGKWHVGDFEYFPELQGFDINVGATVWGCPPTFFYPYRGKMSFGSFRFTPGLQKDSRGKYRVDREGEYLTDRITDEALNILEDIKDKPFMLNLAYYTVHTPIEAKQHLIAYYEKKLKPGMSHQNPVYAAMVHILDENVGRVLNKLDELGLTENTVVIFTSDNGGYINAWRNKTVTSNAPLRSGKGSLYEGGIRVPTIIKWPGVTTPGSESDCLTSTQDFYPTVLDISGSKIDPKQERELEGTSLVPVLKNVDAELQRDTLYWHYPHYYPTTTPVSAVRQGKWKLLHFFEDDSVELYNLADDIGETNNLAERYPDKTKELSRLLKKWQKQVNAPMPRVNPDYDGKR